MMARDSLSAIGLMSNYPQKEKNEHPADLCSGCKDDVRITSNSIYEEPKLSFKTQIKEAYREDFLEKARRILFLLINEASRKDF